MTNKILFMILDDDIIFLENSDMDHKEWYASLGRNMDIYDEIIRGFVMDKKIIFFKGFFQYDQLVIKAARAFGSKVREHISENYPVYCGILPNGADGWEPIMKISEEELNIVDSSVKKVEDVTNVKQTGPILEFRNEYYSDQYIKIAIPITICVLFLNLIFVFFQLKKSGIDIILILVQVAFFLVTCIGYYSKKPFAKFTGLLFSTSIIFTFQLPCVILGVLYGLFTIDLGYYHHVFHLLKKILKKE